LPLWEQLSDRVTPFWREEYGTRTREPWIMPPPLTHC
jgi:hypothetical protein